MHECMYVYKCVCKGKYKHSRHKHKGSHITRARNSYCTVHMPQEDTLHLAAQGGGRWNYHSKDSVQLSLDPPSTAPLRSVQRLPLESETPWSSRRWPRAPPRELYLLEQSGHAKVLGRRSHKTPSWEKRKYRESPSPSKRPAREAGRSGGSSLCARMR
jgi:hypothetical protein